MGWAMLVLVLATTPAVAEPVYEVILDPCRERLPESRYDKPSCADHAINSELIAAVRAGDRSALQLLEHRYWLTEQYQERHRLARVLLGRVGDDSAIWNEIHANAQLAVRFAGVEAEVFERWCEENDFYWLLHRRLLEDALEVARSDPRGRSLRVKEQ